jgi:hypothetical protein
MSTKPSLVLVHDRDRGTAAQSAGENSDVINVIEGSQKASATRLDIDELYSDTSLRPDALNSALALLHEGAQVLDQAVDFLRDGDLIAADDSITRFQALLPELFCFRSLGDGFALVVSSMFHAVKNLAGKPVTEEQALAAAFLTRFLRSEPYCSIDTAIDVVEKLVDAGLNVEPPLLHLVADELDG